MQWEALTALGSMLSALVIAVSAFLGVRELRELQRATQFDGTERLLNEFYGEDQRELIFTFLHTNWPVLSDVIGIVRDAENNRLRYDKTEFLYNEGQRYARSR